ncbi:MAG: hypothetical protein J0H88_22000 [Sphingomonadales bacterium]|nr:hypothetical protein [Sphingomonadales bacterium]
MIRSFMAGAALALVAVPGVAAAQEGAKFDCVVKTATPDVKANIGVAMTGEIDEASREALFKQLGAIVDGCAAKNKVADANKGDYFDYNLARISREWLVTDLAKANLKADIVDKALDFGPRGANPDLTGDMTDEQINSIVQGYIAAGVDIDSVNEKVWEKVGAYAAATSIYWNKRKLLPF